MTVIASNDGFLEHLKSLRRAVLSAGADFLIAGDTLQALVRHGKRHWLLHPQFVTLLEGGARRTPALHDQSGLFAGWRPYVSRTWPLAADRAAFRRYVAKEGLAAPGLSLEAPVSGAVVVSRFSAANGRQVEGPFRSASERPLDVARGDSYEPFLRGDFVKVWFWNGTPICAERERLPYVVGDGTATIRDILLRAAALVQIDEREREGLLARCELVALCDGRTLSTVLPAGTKQAVALGYGASPLHGGRDSLSFLNDEPEWMPSMRRAGFALHAAIPDPIRSGTLFSVDAIVDDAHRAFLLEMDCNPVVHPLVYPAMIGSLVAAEQQSPPAPQQSPAA
jgi:hypothetical protein